MTSSIPRTRELPVDLEARAIAACTDEQAMASFTRWRLKSEEDRYEAILQLARGRYIAAIYEKVPE